MNIAISDEPARLVAVVRRTVPMAELTEFYDTAFTQIFAALGAAGATPAGPALGWYHGMPTDTIDIAAGFPVTGATPGPLDGEVEVVEIPGGPAITAEYQGGYDGLPDAWAEVEEYRAGRDLAARDDFLEEYVTEPTPDGDPALNRTRLVLPLR